ncbi:hypothetical protein [uncultured Zoogloea sp.]|uniref:hypothetical protein n=1 Tax=uncultured Zoogloea sp. TaxID=160237 RepID=UPI002609E98D|nr:hypothetical protein [uncultured Zoogloea sp.]
MLNWSLLRTPEGERREDARALARAYLDATDWYVTRAVDPSDGRPLPEDVIDRRRAARTVLNGGTDA